MWTKRQLCRFPEASRGHNAEGAMSTVRIKRKHVLDSDSDDDDAPSTSIAVASVSNGSSEKENAGVAPVGPPADGEATGHRMFKKRLTKKAASPPPREVVVIEDGPGTAAAADDDDVIVVDDDDDAPPPPPRANEGDDVAIEDDIDEPDQALVECAKISRKLRRALGADDDAKGKSDGPLSPGASHAQNGGRRKLVTARDVAAVAGEGSLANGLKPYQMVGVNFLLLLDEQDVPGAILADEMGLGKTAQTIAYLACSRAANQRVRTRGEPALVVAPASLLENWRRELAQWAPALRVGFYHGAQSQHEVRSAAEAWSSGPRGDGRVASGGGAFDVVIACYSIFERDSSDSKEKRAWLRSLNYSHLVLDEAHLVKNRQTQRARRLDAVATKARRRVLLTGTPLQNNLGELESLIHLVLPGLLEEGALGGEDGEDDACELVRAHRLARVKEILRPFILRRLKEDVAKELIPKTQEKRVVEMGESQRRQYAAAVEAARNERRRAREAASSKSSSGGGGGGLPSGDADSSPGGVSGSPGGGRLTGAKVKALFVHLRKIANHPLLVRERYGDAEVAEIVDVCHRRGVFGHEAPLAKVESHVRSLSDFDLHQLCGEQGHLSELCLPVSAFAEAAKTAALVKLLDEIKSRGSRPLIFSQWKIVLDILEWVLRDRGHVFCRLDGSTDVHERQQICDAFNRRGSEIFCFLLSTRAGGQGLNLTGADTVIIHDCDFNPQIDRQAEDRCHRLGQTRPVTVHRLVTAGTVDERIVQIAERKLDLDAAVLSDTKAMAAEENKAMHSIIEDLLS